MTISPDPQPPTLNDLMPAPMQSPPTQPVNRTLGWAAIAAGAAIVIASFLPWGSVTAPIVGTVTASGTDGADGWITAAVGALIAGYGYLALRRRPPVAVTALAALAGLGVAGVALWKIIDLRSKVAELRAEMKTDGDELGIAAAMADAVHVRVGAGLYLLIAAGFAAAVYIAYSALKRS